MAIVLTLSSTDRAR